MRRFDPVAFRAALTRAGMSTPALARQVGISESYAFTLRAGRIPSEAVRQAVSTALATAEDALWPPASSAEGA